MKDAEIGEKGSQWEGHRWCQGHLSWHGFLHICPMYNATTRHKIKKMALKFIADCKSGDIKISVNGVDKGKWKNLKEGDL